MTATAIVPTRTRVKPSAKRSVVTPAHAPRRPRADIPVAHLTCEYLSYARTGGLAEAVAGIATEQARSGRRTLVFLPLYGWIRSELADIEPVGEPFEVRLGDRVERARLYRHRSTEPGTPETFFVEHQGFFDRTSIYGGNGGYHDNHLRFPFFTLAALHALREVAREPVLVHAHDWHTALAPVFLRSHFAADPFYDDIATVLTVHNAGYQGRGGSNVPWELGLGDDRFRGALSEHGGGANLLKGGLSFAEVVTTVSPTHASELLTPVGGFGLHETFGRLEDRFVGILNGIDQDVWNPSADPWIDAPYGEWDLTGKATSKERVQRDFGLEVRRDLPLVVMVSRLVEQKGIDLVLGSRMIPDLDAQWIFLGEGEERYRDALSRLAQAAPGKVATGFRFSEEMEHRLLSAADALLMPSLYEPCGLTQMRAQRYGATPIVRRVGGLIDTVDHGVTGFLFDRYEPAALEGAVRQAIDLYRDPGAWREMVRRGMSKDFSFHRSADAYATAYARAARLRRDRRGLDGTGEAGSL